MGIFGKIKDAKFTDGGRYMLAGTGRVEIQAVKYIDKTFKTKQPAFVVEVKYLESNNPERPVGDFSSWFVGLDKDWAMGNVRQFVETLVPGSKELFNRVGSTPAEIAKIEEDCDKLVMGICSEANPLRGFKARFTAADVPTRKQGQTFTKVKWLPDEMTEEQVAKEQA